MANLSDIVTPTGVVTPDGTQTLTNKTIDASQLTGALPALDGSALTGIAASTAYGAVGTYGLFYRASAGQKAPGVTVAGSALFPANTYDNGSANNPSYSGSGSPSGTWRLMGQHGYYNGTIPYNSSEMNTSVYVRIS